MQEKGNISIHTENIFPIIKKFLYSDNEIFLRELVSNAVDAVQKIKRLAAMGQYNGSLGDPKVSIAFDKENKTITVSDSGIGMTAEEIKKYINQIAFSGAEEFVEKFKDSKDANELIGKFGLGFYSAFMVADQVEIQTLSCQEGATAAHWVCDGSTEFEITEGSRTERGTDIILHINADSEEFLDKYKLEGILEKYCKFLPIPVQFGTKPSFDGAQDDNDDAQDDSDGVQDELEEAPEDAFDGGDDDALGEANKLIEENFGPAPGKEKKRKEVEVPNIINNTTPIWTKAPTELKDEDYLRFYKELYPMGEDPLFWIHLNVDYPFNLTGVLYFPKVKNEIELQRNKIKLFSRQVFITDEVKDIVPEFLMLLHGVIDSPDIPLNVSRSFLQADGNVKKINSYITRKVADKLTELFKNDRKGYEEKWNDIGLFVKYGMISDEKFYDKAVEFTLLSNTKKEHFTLTEYKEKVSLLQTDKDGKLVYIYCSDPAKQDSFVQSANKKGYDVLLMNSPLDSHYIQKLEMKLENTRIKRVDADVVDKLIAKEEKIESVLTTDETGKVKAIFEKAINRQDMKVEVEGMSLDEQPVTVTMDEFMRRMKDMAQMGGGMSFYGMMPDNYNVSINGNNKLVGRILKADSEDEQLKLAKQAFDLALLSQGMLTGAELTEFVNRSLELI